MTTASKMYLLHCLSPVHVGAGQGVGFIDMPIMRERVTQWPLIPGSSVKGVKREQFRLHQQGNTDNWLDAAFGKQGDADGSAGSLVMSDSKLLVFPVASYYGTYAYVTCPMAIQRLERDLEAAGLTGARLNWNEIFGELGSVADGIEAALFLPDSKVTGHAETGSTDIYLDEFQFHGIKSEQLKQWGDWLERHLFGDDMLSGKLLKERLVLVNDEAFQYFVTMCCEVVPRIRIKQQQKTVDDGALWHEEYLPAESIMYGLVWCDNVYRAASRLTREELLDKLSGEAIIQIGGNASVGKGRVRCRYAEGAAR